MRAVIPSGRKNLLHSKLSGENKAKDSGKNRMSLGLWVEYDAGCMGLVCGRSRNESVVHPMSPPAPVDAIGSATKIG